MSCHVIYYENGAKMMRPVLSESEYRALRGGERNVFAVRACRAGDAASKKKLVQMNYSCLPNVTTPPPSMSSAPTVRGIEEVRRGGKGGGSPLKGCTTPSNSVGMDVDFDPADPDYEQKMAAVPELVFSKKDALGLLMLERSVKKGYHIVFKRRAELTQEENLRWASDLLGVKYDEGAKDITRVFFTTTDSKEDLLFLDQKLFSSEELGVRSEELFGLSEELGVRSEELSPSPNSPRSSTNNSSLLTPHSSLSQTPHSSLSQTPHSSLNYQGVEYAMIISKYWELYNHGKEPCKGNRNALTFELAMVLRSICEYSQAQLEQIIPQYDGLSEEEWRTTIANALKEPRKGIPSRLKMVLEALNNEKKIVMTGGTLTSPPPMPEKLPPLLKLLTKHVPDQYKPAVANAVFPALGAHLHGVKFRYIDNVDHEATFMNLLVGCQSVGKGSIKKPIEYIMADIKESDEPNRRREAEWKRKNPANSSKPKEARPSDICIQMLIDNLTDAVFNQRVSDVNANGQRYIYTIVDEVEALKRVTSKGTVDELTLLIRKAFDNSMHGQERVGADSVTGYGPLRWNWNASTTPPNARRVFRKAVSDGTLSRLDVCTIFKQEKKTKGEIPVQGIYDEKYAEDLKEYIDRLNAASGLIECSQAQKLAHTLVEECDDMSQQMESDAYEILSYRGIVIAWLKGLVLYIAHDYKWSKEIADFVRWSLQYSLWCKMLYFGQQLEAEIAEEKNIQNQSGPRNMLQELPEEFTREEYYQMRSRCGKTDKGDSTLRVWISRGYVVWDEIAQKFINKKAGNSY